MRLIDADATKQKIEGRYESALVQAQTRRSGKTIHQGIAIGMNFARNVILDQPTIEAEPVRHGEWVPIDHDIYGCRQIDSQCSECLREYSDYDRVVKKFNYCPNCGAKMDGRDDHENV